MEIITLPERTVLAQTHTLTLAEVGLRSAATCPALEQRARQLGLTIDGPWQFVAEGLPERADHPFTLRICLPVQGEHPALTRLPACRCARRLYQGPLNALFEQGYQPLLAAIRAQGLPLSGESREVYHHWAGPDSPDNRIEIQFVLA
ncbi:GyrI-like domain-containing protein [Aeromonas simiae]|uniref:GyrI-like domain-containing protein n=1 Tax=Aeromonas simiae TaxID=218936 RepID=UPI00266CE206|nr:GyrI-like domain-containing protein [Aeromonas simiae]MDO2949351.1 GyrI-like domain-containing protein [Aeromonas simiae]MDO2952815.1 GyrI-like domain-containing protein [Aeromonas simiae]MDO2956526.1 GyrI-like domain-containing protein [Aeromonas simiae]